MLCENQKLSIDPHPGVHDMDSMHWGRPEIINAVDEMLLRPEGAKILSQNNELLRAKLAEARSELMKKKLKKDQH